MTAKSNKKSSVDESTGFGLNLGALLQAKGVQSQQQEERAEARVRDSDPSFAPIDLTQCGKLVLREERKGRGGKTVTVIRGVAGTESQLKELAQRMRRALGCGGSVEDGDVIVLQGEQLERTRLWLEQQGTREVILGSRPKRG